MATLSVSDLQDLAVRCTTQFLAQGTSLNQLIAKEASDRGLNQEQLKRSVEAVNTLAYLKTLEKSGSDRTTEFQVADYHEILKIASIPEHVASQSVSEDPWLAFLSSSPGQTKQASILDDTFPELDVAQAKAGIIKQAQINARLIEELEVEASILASRLMKVASFLALDQEAQSKLSVVASGDTFTKLARLVFKEDRAWKDLPETLFTKASLEKAASLKQTFEEAQELTEVLASRKTLQKQASEVVALEKQAFIGALAGMAGRAVGGLAKWTGKTVAKPFVGLARAGGNVAANSAKKTWNSAANTGVGKAFKMGEAKIVAPNPVVGKRIAAAGVVGGAAMDASMYSPKINPVTGEGGDVWKKLQG